MPDPLLTDLAAEVRELSESAEHTSRRKLWVDFHALKAPRALASYGMYPHVWERCVAPEGLMVRREGLARSIELQLRCRLWKARELEDDEPINPTIWLAMPRPRGGVERLWKVPLEYNRSKLRESYKPIPPIQSEADLDLISQPAYQEDAEYRDSLLEQARELINDTLPIKFQTDEVHYGPFEWAVRMRGIENLLLDVYDRPEWTHRLMDRITSAMIAYHQQREAAGAVDAETSWGFHMYYDEIPAGQQGRLAGSWAYVHAQSAASLSPEMYAEFIQPYNARLASLFWKIYYHGCEDLSRKCRVIGELPGLRLFHVGPWTPLEPVIDCLGNSVAYEVHSHPANVLFNWNPSQIAADIKRLHSESDGTQRVLKLCDVETFADRGARLLLWAKLASEQVRG